MPISVRRIAFCAAVACAAANATGCIDSSRVNRTCRWIDASSATLNLERAADREHLRQDVQMAWEVGQRYADVRYRSQPLLARPLLDSCRSAMFDSIVARHGVARADIARATMARRWPVDIAAVFLPMLVVTVVVTGLMDREIPRLVSTARQRVLARTVVAGVAALIMTGLMQIWAMSVESWRLRDEHIAGRAFVVPSVAHPGIALAAMVTITAAVLFYRSRSRLDRRTIP